MPGERAGTVSRRARVAAIATALGVGSLAAALVVPQGSPTAGDGAAPAAAAADTIRAAYGKLPLRFEANRGQTDKQVRFLSRGAGYTLFLTQREAVLSLSARGKQSAVIRMRPVGANPNPRVEGLGRQAGRTNYLKGNDRSNWRTNVPGFSRVRYRSVYPGIDQIYYGRQGTLEYDFVVRPGADPRRIALDFRGAKRVAIDRSGDLVLSTAAGTVRQARPVLYQTIGGKRRRVAGRYVMRGKGRAGFVIGRYDRALPLTIDPVMVYSTFLGGEFRDRTQSIAVDAAGAAYVTGRTTSLTFPTTPGAFQRVLGGAPNRAFFDVFVAKLNPSGTALAYSTYLGGTRTEDPSGIAVDGTGRAVVVGFINAGGTGFPTTPNAFAQTPAGGRDAFLSVLKADGSGLDYSTYLGGTGTDTASGVALTPSGQAYVAGGTSSANFPATAGAFQTAPPGGGDAFAAHIDPSLTGSASLVAATHLGGSDFDDSAGIAVDPTSAYLAGFTLSTDFPTANPFQSSGDGVGNGDAFVTRLPLSLTAPSYSTYLGGAGGDFATAIAVDGAQRAYLAGDTDSADFPVAGAFQPDKRGFGDVFVARLDASGASLSYASYLGGSGSNESGSSIAVDGSGGAYVTGVSDADDLAVADPVAPRGRSADAFVARVKPGGDGLSFLSYLGGGNSEPFGEVPVAVDAAGSAYVAGTTSSTDFPTVAPLQPASADQGIEEAFVAKLAPDPAGAPYVNSVAPVSGPAGTRVTIRGRGFTGATAVRFDGEPATSFTVDSHNEITAIAPGGVGGPAAVTVTRPAGTSPPNPITRFRYAQGTWRPTGAPATASGSQTVTVLRNGRVLLVGAGSAQLYDPATGDWMTTAPLNVARDDPVTHTATLLTAPACAGSSPPSWCGKVLVEGAGVATGEVYDPTTGTWSMTAPASVTRRGGETATLLPDGRVLVAGGRPPGSFPTASAEIYDPATNTWSAAPNMSAVRADHTATLIGGAACRAATPPPPCGKVLVAGGTGRVNNQNAVLTTALLYDPATNTWSDTARLDQRRAVHTATPLPDGRVLVAGGDDSGVSTNWVEIYDPASAEWFLDSFLADGRGLHSAVGLADGRVLVTGGVTGSTVLRTAEIYDPARRLWSSAGLAGGYRVELAMAAAGLPNGDVLVVESSAELYRPSALPGALVPPETQQPQQPPEDAPPVLETSPGSAPQTAPGRDGQRPVVRAVRVLDRSFEIGSLLPLLARQSRVGTRIQFTLSELATVRLTFARARPGRRVGATCRTPTRRLRTRPRCTRYVTVRPSVTIPNARAGANSVRFQGRLSRTRALRPGRYRLTVTATDAASNRSAPRTATFTLLRAARARGR